MKVPELLQRRACAPVVWCLGSSQRRANRLDVHILALSLMLTVNWRSTAPGIATTVASVAINCVLYMAVAYALYRVVLGLGLTKSVRS
jgi:hypothetical protein